MHKRLIILGPVYLLLFFGCEDTSSIDGIDSLSNSDVKSAILDPNAVTTEDSLSTEWYFFQGTIGDYDQQVVMELGVTGTNVTGRYFYARHQKYLSLVGDIDTLTDSLHLTESYLGKSTGFLSFKLDTTGVLEGNWFKKKHSARQPITLEPIPLTLKDRNQMDVRFSKFHREKTIEIYEGPEKGNVTEEVVDELMMSEIDDKHFSFYYNVIGTNAHTGSVEGIATLVEKDYAIFRSTEGCMLSFKFDGTTVHIEEEEDCSYFRGQRAYFTNELKRVR